MAKVKLLNQFSPLFERQERYYIYFGGRSCVRGDTLISTPNGNIKIRDFNGGQIYATNGNKTVVAYACKPVVLGKEQLYKVTTENRSIVTTANHRFLTEDGWKSTGTLQTDLDYLFALPCEDLCCERTFESSQVQHQTILDTFQKGFDLGVQHYLRTILGWLYRCLQDYHLCDGQLLQGVSIYRDVLPLLADVQQHKSHVLSHKDDQDISYICDQTYQILCHLCNSSSQKDEDYKNSEDLESCIACMFFELLSELCSAFEQFRERKNPVLLAQESARYVLDFCSLVETRFGNHQIVSDTLLCVVGDSPYSNSFRGCKLDRHYTKKERILEVKNVGEDYFYDMFVPFYNNYFGNGIINHNSGKSWGIADSLLLMGRMCRERILCTREVQKSIDTSSYQLLCDRIAFHGFTDYVTTKTSIKNTITGSEFIFAGLSDITGTADSLKSIENISVCWIEEAQTVSAKSFEKLTPSIRGKNSNGQGSIIIMSLNPETVNDPVYVEFMKDPKPRTLLTHINYLDNPYCPKEIIEEAESMKENKPDDYKRIWLGVPDDFSNRAVVKYFRDDNITEVAYCEDEDLILTMDFNVDPMMWCVCHKDDSNLYQLDEIVIENCTTEDAAGEFINRYPNHKGNIILCGDASGQYRKTQSKFPDYTIVKNVLLKYGYNNIIQNTRGFNPPITHRIRAFNQLVMDNEGERHYFVDPKCKWTIYNMRNLLYKQGTSVIDLPTPAKIESNPDLKFVGHIFDAISYPAEYYWPLTLYNERVENRVDPSEQWTMKNIIERNERKSKW